MEGLSSEEKIFFERVFNLDKDVEKEKNDLKDWYERRKQQLAVKRGRMIPEAIEIAQHQKLVNLRRKCLDKEMAQNTADMRFLEVQYQRALKTF